MNNRNNRSIVALALLSLGGLVLAQTTLPFTFSSGTPIKAADINSNFQALLTGVNNMGNLTTDGAPERLILPNGRFRTGELRAENSDISSTTGETTNGNMLLRLRAGSPLADRFRVSGSGSLVATGALGYGIIPATGAGERMMWYPFKAAFRAGSIGTGGTQWDDSNVGFYSWAGGYNSTASGFGSFAVGYAPEATATYSTAIGYNATAAKNAATAIGYNAKATGDGSTAMGYTVLAAGDHAVALGYRAATCSAPVTSPLSCGGTEYDGAFVLADASTTGWLSPSGNNQFNSRYAGGYRLYTNANMTAGVSINAGGASWNVMSDKNAKTDFKPVDVRAVLESVVKMPVTTWRYKEESGAPRHMGVMAQDFRAAFGLNTTDKTINTVDADGVALAAVQGLNAKLEARDREITALKQGNAKLASENAALKAQMQSVLDRLARLEQNAE
ncbi:tail fiber domain-containing protein [Deinococcus hopiensis]|uniref:Head domain of trimeric autotransporter adhesin n=1 Tax=Deinococcus hopiensis KR-140 TaxID=695939 RepID=A0A1W1UYK2_9DEIO|nr:tail fiber domain-containing protein [Deinococcus hopiensis]SMB86060.1 Head domain of trimeric autotransporter adhesin [Deinococcus hopiensis KR-140]